MTLPPQAKAFLESFRAALYPEDRELPLVDIPKDGVSDRSAGKPLPQSTTSITVSFQH